MTVEQTSPMPIEVEAFFGPAAVPWTGTSAQRRAAVVGLVGGFAVTTVYVVIARHVFNAVTTQIEFWSLIASLACVWLCRTENVLANPIGIVAVLQGWASRVPAAERRRLATVQPFAELMDAFTDATSRARAAPAVPSVYGTRQAR